MASGFSDVALKPFSPGTVADLNQLGGQLHVLFATFTNPSSGGVGIAENIRWGQLPYGARVLGGYLTCSAGAASSTLNLGDTQSPARYLAATSVASASNISLNPPATFANGGAGYTIAKPVGHQLISSQTAGDDSLLYSVCAGAPLGAGQTLTLYLLFAAR